MSLLQAGVDTAVIALWLGHADIRSTNTYLHADMTIKQRALDLLTPTSPHRVDTGPPTGCWRSSKPCNYADPHLRLPGKKPTGERLTEACGSAVSA
jgi:hypothetical protein